METFPRPKKRGEESEEEETLKKGSFITHSFRGASAGTRPRSDPWTLMNGKLARRGRVVGSIGRRAGGNSHILTIRRDKMP